MSVFFLAMFLFCLTLVPPLPIVAAAVLPLIPGFEDIFRVNIKEMKVIKNRGNRTNKW
jgi:hypothetical protein